MTNKSMTSNNVHNTPRSLLSAFKPLHILSTLIGIAPFNFDLTSSKPAVVYSVTITIFGVVTIIKLMIHFLHKFASNDKEAAFVIPLILNLGITGGSAIIAAITGMVTSRNKFTQIIENLHYIDKRLFQNHPGYYKMYIILLIETITVTLSQVLYPLYKLTFGKDDISVLLLTGQFLVNQMCLILLVQFVNIVYLLRTRYSTLNKKIESYIYSSISALDKAADTFVMQIVSENDLYSHHSTKIMPWSKGPNQINDNSRNSVISKIRVLRKVHNQLFKTARIINAFYGFQLILKLTVLLMTLTISIYSLLIILFHTGTPSLQEMHAKNMYGSIYGSIFATIELVCIAYVCHVTADEANRTSLLVQDYILLDNLDNDVISELNSFAQQLTDKKLEFTANGLFPLDITLLLSIAGTAATFIIILLQS